MIKLVILSFMQADVDRIIILPDGKVDYETKTNNGDVNTILATTATTAYKFFGKYPQNAVFLKGNIPGKTRLHQMAINTAYAE